MIALPKILFLGTAGDFSSPPLTALLDAGPPVQAVVVPGRGAGNEPVRRLVRPETARELPVLGTTRQGIVQHAWDHCIPVLEAARLRDPACLGAVRELDADLICVACFPWILPPELLAMPRLGCLNVHPSLLPAHRGPAPLFWTFRYGDAFTGVTVHWMDAGIDTGDIALQEEMPIPEGISGLDLQRECAERGARLLVKAVRAIANGDPPRRPQPPGGSYESWPGPEELLIPVSWSARRAYNFIRGVGAWGRPLIELGDQILPVRAASGYDENATMSEPFALEGGELAIRCAPGVLHARV